MKHILRQSLLPFVRALSRVLLYAVCGQCGQCGRRPGRCLRARPADRGRAVAPRRGRLGAVFVRGKRAWRFRAQKAGLLVIVAFFG